MRKIVFFMEKPNEHGAFHFVSAYRRGRWFRREKIGYSLSVTDACMFMDNEMLARVCERIKKDYPEAGIVCMGFSEFQETYKCSRFYVIRQEMAVGSCKYYSDTDRSGGALFTTDITDIRFILSESARNETLRNLRQKAQNLMPGVVYLNLTNELLTPVMMISCTNKKNGETKFFARLEGNRVRLVNTSNAAQKFDYEGALKMFEHLRTANKNFLYAVLPAFKDNVNCRNLESYMKKGKVSRMIAMDLKLKYLNVRLAHEEGKD